MHLPHHEKRSDTGYDPVRTLDDAEERDALETRRRARMLKFEALDKANMILVFYGVFMLFFAGLAAFVCSLLYVVGTNSCNYTVVAKIRSHSVLPHRRTDAMMDPMCDFDIVFTDQYFREHAVHLHKKPCRLGYFNVDGALVIDGCLNWRSPQKLKPFVRGDDDEIFPKRDLDNVYTALLILAALLASAVVMLVLSCLVGSFVNRKRDELPT